MQLLKIRIVLYVLCFPIPTPGAKLRRSLPQDFPHSRPGSGPFSSFPQPQESVGFNSFDVRLHNNEENPEFPHYHHSEEDGSGHAGHHPHTESPSATTIPSSSTDSPPKSLPAPPIRITDAAWQRFKRVWNRFSDLNKHDQLSLNDKLRFLSEIQHSETVASLIWPSVFVGSTLIILTILCVSCCCIPKSVLGFGRPFGVSPDTRRTPHEPLTNIEMSPIVKTPINAFTDDELDRLSFYLHRRQTRSAEADRLGSEKNSSVATSSPHPHRVTFSASPTDSTTYDDLGNPLPTANVQVHLHDPPKPATLIQM